MHYHDTQLRLQYSQKRYEALIKKTILQRMSLSEWKLKKVPEQEGDYIL